MVQSVSGKRRSNISFDAQLDSYLLSRRAKVINKLKPRMACIGSARALAWYGQRRHWLSPNTIVAILMTLCGHICTEFAACFALQNRRSVRTLALPDKTWVASFTIFSEKLQCFDNKIFVLLYYELYDKKYCFARLLSALSAQVWCRVLSELRSQQWLVCTLSELVHDFQSEKFIWFRIH